MADAVASAIKSLAQGHALSAAEAADAFGEVMRGSATATQIAALLMALRVKGETSDEVAGAAKALRDAMRRVDVPAPDEIVDTCGTGGGTVTTFNISTAAAFVAAGAGVRVAKHGNRSFTTKCGSADVLEGLGIAIELPLERLPDVMAEAGLMFMFAPAMHPAMRHVGPVRRELAVPTVMNIVGPLANPAGARRQVIGVGDRERVPLIAGAVQRLGALHALVVHGEPGMDEISPLGPTLVIEVRNGELQSFSIDPARYGLLAMSADELAGGDVATNATIIEDLLSGGGTRAALSAVLLNAAAAIYVAGRAPDVGAGIEVARESIRSGKARAALEALRRASK